MKLASLRSGRDGELVVVSRDLARAVRAQDVAPTLQRALDDWARAAPGLQQLADALEAGSCSGAFALDPGALAAPLPRAYQWIDGSAYVNHVELVRKARGAELPASFWMILKSWMRKCAGCSIYATAVVVALTCAILFPACSISSTIRNPWSSIR